MTADARQLVLGAYSHYPVEMLHPFVRSLRACGYEGRFHIVAAGYDADTLTRLRELADHVRPVDAEYTTIDPRLRSVLSRAKTQKGLRRLYPALFEAAARATTERGSLDRWRNLEYHLEGLQSLRYTHYLRSLIEDAPAAEVVLITDLRDVVFQGDPFADPVTGLEVYLEDPSERVGVEGFNTRWLRNLYGDAFVDRHRDRPISCSGTVVGTREAMLEYLTEMIGEIVWRRRPMGSHDQGVHNGLLLGGRLARATQVPNGSGRVATLGRVAAPVVERGLVINADRTVPVVVHQWDRHPSVAPSIRALDGEPAVRTPGRLIGSGA